MTVVFRKTPEFLKLCRLCFVDPQFAPACIALVLERRVGRGTAHHSRGARYRTDVRTVDSETAGMAASREGLPRADLPGYFKGISQRLELQVKLMTPVIVHSGEMGRRAPFASRDSRASGRGTRWWTHASLSKSPHGASVCRTPHAENFGLSASVERAGVIKASTRIDLGVSVLSTLATSASALRSN
jgi:hypothetical protein